MPEVKLSVNLNAEVHIHHHYHHSSSQPGAADILNAIRDTRKAIMTKLDTSVAQEAGDFQSLLTAVEALETAFGDTTALKAALDAANLDAETQAGILDANDAAIQAAKDKINALLNPTPPPPPVVEPPVLVTTSLPDAVTGQSYTGQITFSGGTAPVTITNAPLTDNGFTVDSNGGVSGTGMADATSAFGVSFQDSASPPATGSGFVTLVSGTAAIPV